MSEDNKNAPQKPQKESSNNKSAKVESIDEYRNKKAKDGQPPCPDPIDKLYTRSIVENELVRWFGGGAKPEKMPDDLACLDDFPCYGYRLQPSDPIRYLRLDRKNGTAEFIGKDELDRELFSLFDRFQNKFKAYKCYLLSSKQREQLAPKFMAARLFRGEIKPTGYLKTEDDDTFCFHRYDFTPIRNAAYFPGNFNTIATTAPIFTSFLRRMENAEPLCQVVGAALAGKPIRKQAVLISGEPNCGKSMFLSLLSRIFGDGWKGFTRDWQDRFAASSLENSLAWGIDEVDARFVNSEFFKQITGSETLEIRRPYQPPYDAKLAGNFYMNCNDDKLFLYNNKAIVEGRLILCRIKGVIAEKDRLSVDDLMEKMKSEMPYIHGYCLDVFAAFGNHVDKDMTGIREVVENTEADLKDLFDEYFIIDEEAVGHKAEVSISDFRCTIDEIMRVHPSLARQKCFEGKFKKFVAAQLGRPYYTDQVRKGGSRVRMVTKVRLRKQI